MNTPLNEREVVNPALFLEMSADISYRLSGTAFDPRALLDIIFLGVDHSPCDEALLVRAISVLRMGYGDRRRKLGPLAVVHPIRTTALLARITHDPSTLDLIGALLHDKDEDLLRPALGDDRWGAMTKEFGVLDGMLDEAHRWYLGERMALLTRTPDMSYCSYLVRLLGQSGQMPDLLRVKLADRLDNTLDVGTNLHGIPGQGVFGVIFDILFLPCYTGLHVPSRYVPLIEAEGVQILANLFKNAMFVSLLRSEKCSLVGSTSRLCCSLLTASIRIAQFIVHDAFGSLDSREQRTAVREVMAYCSAGGLSAVRKVGTHPLDGLFLGRYGDTEGRKSRLREVFFDRPLFARVGLVFLALFSNFFNDPNYLIEGIGQDGVWAVD
jgi:hypothetical protein